MGAVASLSETRLAADPGGQATCQVRIRNTGEVVDEFSLEVVGHSAAWSHITPPTLRLFPGDEGAATLSLQPPRSSDTSPGEVPFGVRILCKEDPAGSVTEEGILTVAPFDELTAELLPRTSRGRRKATHQLAVDNRGNRRLSAEVLAFDQDENLEFDVRPPSVDTPAGTAFFAKVTARPRERYWWGPPQTRQFQVRVEPDSGEPVELQGTTLQEALLPGWLPRALIGLTVLGIALVAVWIGLLRPTIESAAQEAVEEPLEELGAKNAAQDQAIAAASGQAGAADQKAEQALSGSGGADHALTGGGEPSPISLETTVTEPFDFRLATADSPGGGVSFDAFTVEEGTSLEVTDILLQNPVGHAGVVRVRRVDAEGGVTTLLEVALENFRDLDYHFVTPLVFSEGTAVRFDVECTQPARPEEENLCGAGAYFSGTLTTIVADEAA